MTLLAHQTSQLPRMRFLRPPPSTTPASLLLRNHRLTSLSSRLHLSRSLSIETAASPISVAAALEMPKAPTSSIHERKESNRRNISRTGRGWKRSEQQQLDEMKGGGPTLAPERVEGTSRPAEGSSKAMRTEKGEANEELPRKVKKLRHRVQRRLAREAQEQGSVSHEDGDGGVLDEQASDNAYKQQRIAGDSWRPSSFGSSRGHQAQTEPWNAHGQTQTRSHQPGSFSHARPYSTTTRSGWNDKRDRMRDDRPMDQSRTRDSYNDRRRNDGNGSRPRRDVRDDRNDVRRRDEDRDDRDGSGRWNNDTRYRPSYRDDRGSTDNRDLGTDNKFPHIRRPQHGSQPRSQRGSDEWDIDPTRVDVPRNVLLHAIERPAHVPTHVDLSKLKGARLRAAFQAPPQVIQPAPVPTESYVALASEPPKRLSTPSRLLVILDLNGTLMYRPKNNRGSNTRGKGMAVRSANPVLRPGLPEFLKYLFDNFEVMVWTSAQPDNARKMVAAAFKEEQRAKLRAVWGRDTLGLSNSEYWSKVQVYKRLERVWEGTYKVDARTPEEKARDEELTRQQAHPNEDAALPPVVSETTQKWDQTNTVILDDSELKAAGHPYNLVQVPEMIVLDHVEKEANVLRDVGLYLEELKWHDNVSAFIKRTNFQKWRKNFYKKVNKEAGAGETKDPGLDDKWELVD